MATETTIPTTNPTTEQNTATQTAKSPAKAPEPRIFVYNGTELEDPDPALADKDVKKFYEQIYPELTTANLEIKIETREGIKTRVIGFKKAAGTKG